MRRLRGVGGGLGSRLVQREGEGRGKKGEGGSKVELGWKEEGGLGLADFLDSWLSRSTPLRMCTREGPGREL